MAAPDNRAPFALVGEVGRMPTLTRNRRRAGRPWRLLHVSRNAVLDEQAHHSTVVEYGLSQSSHFT